MGGRTEGGLGREYQGQQEVHCYGHDPKGGASPTLALNVSFKASPNKFSPFLSPHTSAPKGINKSQGFLHLANFATSASL